MVYGLVGQKRKFLFAAYFEDEFCFESLGKQFNQSFVLKILLDRKQITNYYL